MGGLKIIPDLALAEFEPELANMLILPGGVSWMSGEAPEVSRAVRAMVAAYRGQRLYRPSRSVSDGPVITANGLAPFAFAAEIFRALAPERGEDIALYEKLYSRGLLD
jgi:hypothetical protein